MVYSCGFRYDRSNHEEAFSKLTPEQFEWWKSQWDPVNFAPFITAPTHWFAGTNDFAFYPHHWQKTIDLVPGAVEQCMKIRWPHGHGRPGEQPREISAFMDEHLKGEKRRIRLTRSSIEGKIISAGINADSILAVSLLFTVDGPEVPWPEREWIAIGGELKDGKIFATLPDGWTAAFLSVVSKDRLFATSDIQFASSDGK